MRRPVLRPHDLRYGPRPRTVSCWLDRRRNVCCHSAWNKRGNVRSCESKKGRWPNGAKGLCGGREAMGLQHWHRATGPESAGPQSIPFFLAEFDDAPALHDLAQLVLDREARIKRDNRAAQVGGSEKIADALTARYYAYNLLTWPEPAVARLRDFIREAYLEMLASMPLLRREPRFIQCWANTVRRGECIHIHNHGDRRSFFSGNLPVQVSDVKISATHYTTEKEPSRPEQIYSIGNDPGLLTLFPSWLLHYTDPWPRDDIRISIAFDIVDAATASRQTQYRVGRKYIPLDAVDSV